MHHTTNHTPHNTHLAISVQIRRKTHGAHRSSKERDFRWHVRIIFRAEDIKDEDSVLVGRASRARDGCSDELRHGTVVPDPRARTWMLPKTNLVTCRVRPRHTNSVLVYSWHVSAWHAELIIILVLKFMKQSSIFCKSACGKIGASRIRYSSVGTGIQILMGRKTTYL
jgi:hypothetical protein